jgi:hypothetical protein
MLDLVVWVVGIVLGLLLFPAALFLGVVIGVCLFYIGMVLLGMVIVAMATVANWWRS